MITLKNFTRIVRLGYVFAGTVQKCWIKREIGKFFLEQERTTTGIQSPAKVGADDIMLFDFVIEQAFADF